MSPPSNSPAPMPVLLVGNAVLDILLDVDHHPMEDEEMRALSRRTDLGGNAANTARVLAALGHPVALLATLAPDRDADELRRLLMDARVDTRWLATADAGHTPVSHILVHQDNGTRTIIHHRALPELGLEDFRALPLDQFGWVHFEGRNVDQAALMMDHLRDAGFAGRVSVEIEKARPGIEGLAARANLVLTCRAYAEARAYADAPALLSSLRTGARNARMTCTWGEAGAWALEPNGQRHHCPAFRPPRVVDTVGAGDVFNAGMIHALAQGLALDESLKVATRLAGFKVGQVGFEGLTRQVD